MRGRLQHLVHLRVFRTAGGGAPRLANDEREHHEHHDGEGDLERELRDLRRGGGKPQLWLRRLDVVGCFTRLDDGRDDDGYVGGQYDSGHARRRLVRDADLRKDEVADTECRDPIAEGVTRPAARDLRDLRRDRLEHLELVHEAADAAVRDQITGIGLHYEHEPDRIANGDPVLVHRGGDVDRTVGRRHRSEQHQEQTREGQNAHQLRLDRALKSPRSAGT